ncbi:MAG: SxtJ family membrane protein [Candidatus Pelagibacter sp.]
MQKNIKLPSNRNFGIVFFIVFLIIALWPLLKQSEIRIWSLIISFIFFVLGLINSKLLTPLNKLWFKFGILLGNIIAPIVMGIVFFLVVTPTGLIMQFFRKDILKLKKNSSNSYWINKDNTNSSMRNQF